MSNDHFGNKTLILAEKRKVGLDLAAGLEPRARAKEFYIEGENHVITWARGHLVRLCEPDHYDKRWKKWDLNTLPIIPEQFDFEIVPEEQKRFDTIKELLHRNDIYRVVLATDPGREGEVIGRLILEQAKNFKPVFRFWTSSSLTPEVVCQTMKNLRPSKEYDALYEAGLARMIGDWLVGMNGTRALTAKSSANNYTFPLGRVKGPVIRIIAKRQKLIDSFESEDYWLLRAKFQRDSGQTYMGSHYDEEATDTSQAFLPEEPPENEEKDQDLDFESVDDQEVEQKGTRINIIWKANRAINRSCHYGLRGKEERKTGTRFFPKKDESGQAVTGTIQDISREIKIKQPPQLFNSAQLYQAAFRELHFPVEKTAQLAQQLYHDHKLITYPRSESQVLPRNAFDQVNVILKSLAADGVVFDQANMVLESLKPTDDKSGLRLFDDRGIIEGHHAIIPTGIPPKNLSRDEERLYALIVKRFLTCLHKPKQYASIQLRTVINNEVYLTRKTELIDPGWEKFAGRVNKGVGENNQIEGLKNGETVTLVFVMLLAQKTSPPAPYNDATLIQDMTHAARFVDDLEKKKVLRQCSGIGTSATRANIIKEIVDAGYVTRRGKGKGLVLEPKGRMLDMALAEQDIMDPGTTAMWEANLEKIAREEGGRGRVAFIQDISQAVVTLIEDVRTIPHDMLGPVNIIGNCPACQDVVQERPLSYSCRIYGKGPQDCDFILWKDRLAKVGKSEITPSEMRQLLSGGIIFLRRLKKQGGKFFDTNGCLAKKERGWDIEFLKDGQKPKPFPKPVARKALALNPQVQDLPSANKGESMTWSASLDKITTLERGPIA